MSHFLLKPHVVGPEDNVTTPDIIVDYAFVDGEARPVNLVTHQCWQQVSGGETSRAAYGLMALGGGALILPVVVLGSGNIVAARAAWRLNNLDSHIGKVTLNGTALAEIGLPAGKIEAAGGHGDTLPRGFLLVSTVDGDSRDSELHDPVLRRRLGHRVVFETIDHDRWGNARPKPRYSVGPTQKEITHFI